MKFALLNKEVFKCIISHQKRICDAKNHNKHLYCRLELLDKDLNVIDNLEGLTIDGSLSIDADSDIRHTFTSTIYLKQNEMISSYSVDEWIDKLVRVYIGIGLSDKNIFGIQKGSMLSIRMDFHTMQPNIVYLFRALI